MIACAYLLCYGSRPYTDNARAGPRASFARSSDFVLVRHFCIDRRVGLRHEVAPTNVKPHLLQYAQECASQNLWARFRHATHGGGALTPRLPACFAFSFSDLGGAVHTPGPGLAFTGIFAQVSGHTATAPVFYIIGPLMVRCMLF